MAFFRKILLVSVKFLSAILGPEMAAPIYGHLEKCVRSAGKTCVHKIPRSRGGGGIWVLGGGGSADFIFMGVGIFLIHEGETHPTKKHPPK